MRWDRGWGARTIRCGVWIGYGGLFLFVILIFVGAGVFGIFRDVPIELRHLVIVVAAVWLSRYIGRGLVAVHRALDRVNWIALSLGAFWVIDGILLWALLR